MKLLETDVAVLRAHLEKYVAVTNSDVAALAQGMQPVPFSKGDFLLTPGQPCQVQWFVVEGVLRAYYEDAQAVEHNVQFAIEQWWTADLGGFFKNQPAELHIQALESGRALALPAAHQEALFQEHPVFERFFRLIVQNAYAQAQRRILATLSLTAEQRFEQFLKRYPGLIHRIPQYHIASYLGVTPEFFSKMKSRYWSAR
jgi:CRP-like cAMP-binding protein